MPKFDTAICGRVRTLRKEVGLNQTEFGKKIEVAQTYLSQIEKASRPVTEKIFKLICLQSWHGKMVNEHWLRNGEQEMFVKVSPEDTVASCVTELLKDDDNDFFEIIIKLIHLYSEMDTHSQQVLRNFSKKLLSTQ